MRTALLLTLALLPSAACQRDPGRDVVPMGDPLRSDGAAQPSTEIIPLEKVSKSSRQ